MKRRLYVLPHLQFIAASLVTTAALSQGIADRELQLLQSVCVQSKTIAPVVPNFPEFGLVAPGPVHVQKFLRLSDSSIVETYVFQKNPICRVSVISSAEPIGRATLAATHTEWQGATETFSECGIVVRFNPTETVVHQAGLGDEGIFLTRKSRPGECPSNGEDVRSTYR